MASADDVCADAWDPEQADFDGDGVGNVCDLCPFAGPAPMLDADGCKALDEPALSRILVAADDVLEGRGDVVELVRVIDEENASP